MFYGDLAWFCVVWVSVLVARRLWRAAHPPVRAAVSLPKRKAPRPLKPRTPNDCPVCGRAHSTPLVGNVHKPGAPAACRGENARAHAVDPRPSALRVMPAHGLTATTVATRTRPFMHWSEMAPVGPMAFKASSAKRVASAFRVGAARRCIVFALLRLKSLRPCWSSTWA